MKNENSSLEKAGKRGRKQERRREEDKKGENRKEEKKTGEKRREEDKKGENRREEEKTGEKRREEDKKGETGEKKMGKRRRLVGVMKRKFRIETKQVTLVLMRANMTNKLSTKTIETSDLKKKQKNTDFTIIDITNNATTTTTYTKNNN